MKLRQKTRASASMTQNADACYSLKSLNVESASLKGSIYTKLYTDLFTASNCSQIWTSGRFCQSLRKSAESKEMAG